jgi:ring-1,2-phenylacetyl-CoA epoxidase subunit PaaC
MARQLLVSAYQVPLWQALMSSTDEVLAGVAGKAVKEAAYALDHARTWVVRLGDGTEESQRRMRDALTGIAPYVDELFAGDGELRTEVLAVLRQVTDAAGLVLPEAAPVPGHGRDGDHTDHLAPLLAELQSVARAHPEATW